MARWSLSVPSVRVARCRAPAGLEVAHSQHGRQATVGADHEQLPAVTLHAQLGQVAVDVHVRYLDPKRARLEWHAGIVAAHRHRRGTGPLGAIPIPHGAEAHLDDRGEGAALPDPNTEEEVGGSSVVAAAVGAELVAGARAGARRGQGRGEACRDQLQRLLVAALLDRPRHATVAVEGLDHVLVPNGPCNLIHVKLRQSTVGRREQVRACVCVWGGLMVMPMGGIQT